MSAWFGSSTPRVAQDPQPPPESDAPTHPNEPAWELVEALEARVKQHDGATPFVTLSWAQGLDGSMAHPNHDDPRLMISGKESMALTHGLRKAHAAIMVGRGTIAGDDPRLSVRMDIDGKDITIEEQPAAIILDGSLNTPPSSNIVSQAQMRRVIIITRGDSDNMCDFQEKPPKTWSMAKIQKGAALSCRGAKVMCLPSTSLEDILKALKTLDIHSVFVEGGVSVVDAFLRRPDLVDQVVVTVAPLFVGGRRPPSGPLQAPLRLSNVETLTLGDDVVVSGQMPSAAAGDEPPADAADASTVGDAESAGAASALDSMPAVAASLPPAENFASGAADDAGASSEVASPGDGVAASAPAPAQSVAKPPGDSDWRFGLELQRPLQL